MAESSSVTIGGRTMRSTPESGHRAGYDGYKWTKGSKVHLTVDTLEFLLAARVTPANEQEYKQVGELAEAVQDATDESVEVAYVDQGYTGEQPKRDAAELWPSCPSRRRASSCCPNSRWSNAASRGPRGSAAWSATTNVCRKPCSAYTSSAS